MSRLRGIAVPRRRLVLYTALRGRGTVRINDLRVQAGLPAGRPDTRVVSLGQAAMSLRGGLAATGEAPPSFLSSTSISGRPSARQDRTVRRPGYRTSA